MATMPNDLIAVIKQKQAEIAKLQAELDEAKALLSGGVYLSVPHHGGRRLPPESKGKNRGRAIAGAKREADALVPNSAGYFAAEAIQAAGHPLHANEIVKWADAKGHKLKLATVVGMLSRRVKKKSVFYRAGRNVFGLLEMRK
jgi:hypothetical protein